MHDFLICRCKHHISQILSTQRIMCKFSILIIDNGRLDSPSCSSSISKKLCLTTTIHNAELRYCFVDSTSTSQKTVILKNDSIVIAKFLSNTSSFFFTKNNTMTFLATAPNWPVSSSPLAAVAPGYQRVTGTRRVCAAAWTAGRPCKRMPVVPRF